MVSCRVVCQLAGRDWCFAEVGAQRVGSGCQQERGEKRLVVSFDMWSRASTGGNQVATFGASSLVGVERVRPM